MKNLLKTIMLMGFVVSGSASAAILYVNNGTDNGNKTGPSTKATFGGLQDAIDAAADGDTIIITGSNFKPTDFPTGADTNDPRNKAFHTDGKNIAFIAGTSGFDYYQQFPTILSGDIDGDGTLAGNSYHVFILDGLDDRTRLDRMQIQGGNADSSSSYVYSYLNPDSVVVNTTISNDVGGGVYMINSSPLLIANYFRNNSSATDGAGLYNLNSSPQIFNSIFYKNEAAGDGAGVFNNNSFPEFVNVSFIQNTAINDGGGIYNQSPSAPMIYSTLFYDNTAVVGTDIAGVNIDPVSSHNASDGSGGNIAVGQGFIDLTAFSASDVFVDIADPEITHSTFMGQFIPMKVGFEPAVSSPLINAGLRSANTLLQPPFDYVLDLGNSQLIDLSTRARSRGCAVDIGAYENSLPVTIYVDSSASSNGSGNSWSDPVWDLQFALDCAASFDNGERTLGDTVKVAQGIYKPTDSPDDVSTDPRDKAFHLDKSIYLKGGYDPLTGLQDLTTPSILSGDFNDDDIVTGSGSSLVISNNNENAYHVMMTKSLELRHNEIDVELSLMENFKIQGGHANGSFTSYLNFSDYDFNRGLGGGMTNYESNSRISHVTFYGNWAGRGGGYEEDKFASILSDVKFINNYSLGGGGLFTTSQATVINNAVFSGNYSAGNGGGVYDRNGRLFIINTLFIGNYANIDGGGLFEFCCSFPLHVYNSTFINNVANNEGGGSSLINEPVIKNTVFFNNTAGSVDSHDIEGDVSPDSTNNASDGTGGNINNMGVFVDLSSLTFADIFKNGNDPDGNDQILATADDGLVPLSDGVLIDMGTDAIPSSYGNLEIETDYDLAGNARFYPLDIDIGAYEFQQSYFVSGLVSGLLPGNSLAIQNNLTDDLILTENDAFAFATPVDIGADYEVSISQTPMNPIQPCIINNPSGTITNNDITDVEVVCEAGDDLIFRDGFE